MQFFLFLIGFFLPVAHADTLNGAGAGAPGVDGMWSAICSAIPCYTDVGGAGSGGRYLIVALSNSIILFISSIIGAVAVCMMIYAGIKIVTSDGAEDKVSEAKKIMLYAAAGVALSLMTTIVISFAKTFMQAIFS